MKINVVFNTGSIRKLRLPYHLFQGFKGLARCGPYVAEDDKLKV